MRTELLRFNGAVERDPAIDAWMKEHAGELGAIAHQWFEVMRKCGDEVRELLHDGCPVACLGDAPFGYVNVFTSHVNVGFFHGAGAAGSGPLVARHRQVHAPCEAETGNGHKRRSATQAHRCGVLGYKGARRKRLAQRKRLEKSTAEAICCRSQALDTSRCLGLPASNRASTTEDRGLELRVGLAPGRTFLRSSRRCRSGGCFRCVC